MDYKHVRFLIRAAMTKLDKKLEVKLEIDSTVRKKILDIVETELESTFHDECW